MTLSREIRKLDYHDQSSTLWLMSFLNRHKRQPINKNIYKTSKTFNFKNIRGNHGMTTSPRSNRRHQRDKAKEPTFAFNVKHELLAKNHLPAHDLER